MWKEWKYETRWRRLKQSVISHISVEQIESKFFLRVSLFHMCGDLVQKIFHMGII
jgi:hypothetical protein